MASSAIRIPAGYAGAIGASAGILVWKPKLNPLVLLVAGAVLFVMVTEL